VKAKLIKPIRYGTRIFEGGKIGEMVTVKYPLTYQNELIYDSHKPIGVFKTEIEIIQE